MTLRPIITDDMLRAAIKAMVPDRIQGFSTPKPGRREWGKPHYIRDVFLPPGEQEIWRGDSYADMIERCEMERLRLGFAAAFGALNDAGYIIAPHEMVKVEPAPTVDGECGVATQEKK